MSFHILVAHGAETLEGVSHLSVCTLLDDGHVSVIYRLPVGRNITVSIEHYDFYCTLQMQHNIPSRLLFRIVCLNNRVRKIFKDSNLTLSLMMRDC